MNKKPKYTYHSIDEYHTFKSFEEIKNVLNYFESLYFKDKNFLFLKIERRDKLNAIISLRQSLSRSIFSFILHNHSSLSDNDLNFISNFYSKYFINNNNLKKRFNLLFYINPINIFYIFYKKFKIKDISNTIKTEFYYRDRDYQYYRRYYWLFSLILYLDDKHLIDLLVSFLDNCEDFYYYYILFYVDRYYQKDSIIQNHHLFQHIILNLDKNNIRKLYSEMRHEARIFLTNFIDLTQEKENLKNNLENF